MNTKGPFPELPTIPNDLEQMTTSVKDILAKMETVNIDKIGAELLSVLYGANQVVKGAGKFINKEEINASVMEFKTSLTLLKQILHKVDQRIEPMADTLKTAIESGHRALEKTQRTLVLVDEVLDANSPLQYKFIDLTSEMSEMARSIRELVDMLERNPNAVIFGKPAPGGK